MTIGCRELRPRICRGQYPVQLEEELYDLINRENCLMKDWWSVVLCDMYWDVQKLVLLELHAGFLRKGPGKGIW